MADFSPGSPSPASPDALTAQHVTPDRPSAPTAFAPPEAGPIPRTFTSPTQRTAPSRTYQSPLANLSRSQRKEFQVVEDRIGAMDIALDGMHKWLEDNKTCFDENDASHTKSIVELQQRLGETELQVSKMADESRSIKQLLEDSKQRDEERKKLDEERKKLDEKDRATLTTVLSTITTEVKSAVDTQVSGLESKLTTTVMNKMAVVYPVLAENTFAEHINSAVQTNLDLRLDSLVQASVEKIQQQHAGDNDEDDEEGDDAHTMFGHRTSLQDARTHDDSRNVDNNRADTYRNFGDGGGGDGSPGGSRATFSERYDRSRDRGRGHQHRTSGGGGGGGDPPLTNTYYTGSDDEDAEDTDAQVLGDLSEAQRRWLAGGPAAAYGQPPPARVRQGVMLNLKHLKASGVDLATVSPDEQRAVINQTNDHHRAAYDARYKKRHPFKFDPLMQLSTLPTPDDMDALSGARFYEDFRGVCGSLGLPIIPLTMYDPALGPVGFGNPGSGLTNYEEFGLGGFRVIKHHWSSSVSDSAIRDLIEVEPGSTQGSMWTLLYRLLTDVIPVFDEARPVQMPTYSGDLKLFARDIILYAVLAAKQGGPARGKIAKLRLFLNALPTGLPFAATVEPIKLALITCTEAGATDDTLPAALEMNSVVSSIQRVIAPAPGSSPFPSVNNAAIQEALVPEYVDVLCGPVGVPPSRAQQDAINHVAAAVNRVVTRSRSSAGRAPRSFNLPDPRGNDRKAQAAQHSRAPLSLERCPGCGKIGHDLLKCEFLAMDYIKKGFLKKNPAFDFKPLIRHWDERYDKLKAFRERINERRSKAGVHLLTVDETPDEFEVFLTEVSRNFHRATGGHFVDRDEEVLEAMQHDQAALPGVETLTL